MPGEPSALYQAGGLDYTRDDGQPLGGLGDLLGRFINNASGTTQKNIFNATQAQIQRDHELYMSNTAYSRAVNDMKAAGLNPASLTQGSLTPASSSSSGAASSAAAGNGILGTLVSALVKLAFKKA